MRLAGGKDVHAALSEHLGDEDGSSESDQSGEGIETFLQVYELLLSKGYSDQLAEHAAVEMIEGREPMAKPTVRFAGVYGDPSYDDRPGSGFNYPGRGDRD